MREKTLKVKLEDREYSNEFEQFLIDSRIYFRRYPYPLSGIYAIRYYSDEDIISKIKEYDDSISIEDMPIVVLDNKASGSGRG